MTSIPAQLLVQQRIKSCVIVIHKQTTSQLHPPATLTDQAIILSLPFTKSTSKITEDCFQIVEMPRGNAPQSKVHYRGKEEDFVIYIDDAESVQKWKEDRSIPLAQVVKGFKIFITHKYEPLSSCCQMCHTIRLV